MAGTLPANALLFRPGPQKKIFKKGQICFSQAFAVGISSIQGHPNGPRRK